LNVVIFAYFIFNCRVKLDIDDTLLPGGGAARLLPRNGGAEKFRRDPTVEPRPHPQPSTPEPLLTYKQIQKCST